MPEVLPHYLPDDWKGGFVLLAMVFVLSSFLDNIAAALIGGTMARGGVPQKVHIGYLAAIVAASNAGGAGSVVGDTTTTMMWIDGVSPLAVFDAYIAASVALVVCGIPAAIQQQRYRAHRQGRAGRASASTGRAWPSSRSSWSPPSARTSWRTSSSRRSSTSSRSIGAAVWVAILVTARRGASPTGSSCPKPSRARCSCSRW